MLIAHSSDQHGNLERYKKGLAPDLWILSGDFFPNETRGEREHETVYQARWLKNNLSFFKELFGLTPILIQDGNHDFAKTCEIFADAGFNTHQVLRKKQSLTVASMTVSFAGFREINWISGDWNGETRISEMSDIVYDVIRENPDILITHAPPQGIMDTTFGYGIAALTSRLFYSQHSIKLHAFGHCHLPGIENHNSMIFSNAATTTNLIEW
jgi:Icc-related predicted phosphoesterase